MRKLVYVGKNRYNEIIETSSYEKMLELKNKGYIFKEVMRELEDTEAIERANKTREKRAKKLKEMQEKA